MIILQITTPPIIINPNEEMFILAYAIGGKEANICFIINMN